MNQKKYLVVFSIHESSSKFGDIQTIILGTREFKRRFVEEYIKPALSDEKGKVNRKEDEELLGQMADMMSREDLFSINSKSVSFETTAGRQFGILLADFHERTGSRVNVEAALYPAQTVFDALESFPSCDSRSASTS